MPGRGLTGALLVGLLLAVACGAEETPTSAPASPAESTVTPAVAVPATSPAAAPASPAGTTVTPAVVVSATSPAAAPAPPTRSVSVPTPDATSTRLPTTSPHPAVPTLEPTSTPEPPPTHTPQATAVPLSSGATPGTGDSTVTKETPEKNGSGDTEQPLDRDAEVVVLLAMEDLAARLGTHPDTISLISVEPVDWPDTSLGNALPGDVFATVIIPGYRVVLSTVDAKYVYHTDRRRAVLVE